ncbi:hypothetical protein FHR81_003175 [Actinoalloteichus hoggarensis]|uniref:Uncharacterized protein n=1 Tax=Actinoalloteichus hoggarensis TaxID=1470176 RepID=A0A221W6H7_9PSEU|nr:hypothetical protein AHOG_19550 [Actinoalloteichus hoggarensis]MBB5922123.1 hypothetical protein [Actinoalloteichus hoggarensis]
MTLPPDTAPHTSPTLWLLSLGTWSPGQRTSRRRDSRIGEPTLAAGYARTTINHELSLLWSLICHERWKSRSAECRVRQRDHPVENRIEPENRM